jgi:hypothetical protein
MKRGLLASAMLLLVTAVNAEPIVVFQSLHDLNYAKNVCEYVQSAAGATNASNEAKTECALATDPRALGRRLELDVRSSFATNPRCAGVTVVRGWLDRYDPGDGHDYLATIANKHWELLLDFTPGSKTHGWSLFRVTANQNIEDRFSGEGTPDQIANAVCIAMTGKGATVR